MVVGKEERTDVKYVKTADIIVRGHKFKNQPVYGDAQFPKRRDIFVVNRLMDRYPENLPEMATVAWMGRRYMADLSFRYGSQGQAIPVYQFFIG